MTIPRFRVPGGRLRSSGYRRSAIRAARVGSSNVQEEEPWNPRAAH